MTRYFTPAALAPLYLPGGESDSVVALLREAPPPLRITSLHSLEMVDRLRASPRAAGLWQQDRRAGYFEVNELSLGDLVRRAEDLVLFGPKLISPLLLLHVAAALEMECAEFVDFGEPLRAAARRAGLRVLPESLLPSEPPPATVAAVPAGLASEP